MWLSTIWCKHILTVTVALVTNAHHPFSPILVYCIEVVFIRTSIPHQHQSVYIYVYPNTNDHILFSHFSPFPSFYQSPSIKFSPSKNGPNLTRRPTQPSGPIKSGMRFHLPSAISSISVEKSPVSVAWKSWMRARWTSAIAKTIEFTLNVNKLWLLRNSEMVKISKITENADTNNSHFNNYFEIIK